MLITTRDASTRLLFFLPILFGLKLSIFVNESLMAGSPHLDGNLMDRFVIRAFEINVKGARKENFSKLSKRRKERKGKRRLFTRVATVYS